MITPERVEEIKALFQNEAREAYDYYSLKIRLQCELNDGNLTEEEYNMIWEHWNEWLPDDI